MEKSREILWNLNEPWAEGSLERVAGKDRETENILEKYEKTLEDPKNVLGRSERPSGTDERDD